MPNQVSPVVEQAILDYISAWPTHGPRRIAQQLAESSWGGVLVSHWGVYEALRREACTNDLPGLGSDRCKLGQRGS